MATIGDPPMTAGDFSVTWTETTGNSTTEYNGVPGYTFITQEIITGGTINVPSVWITDPPPPFTPVEYNGQKLYQSPIDLVDKNDYDQMIRLIKDLMELLPDEGEQLDLFNIDEYKL